MLTRSLLLISTVVLLSGCDPETPTTPPKPVPQATTSPTSAPTTQAARGTIPAPELSPEEVVQIQLTAMQHNDATNDRGIETVFRFASPQNRAMTGPLNHFAQMVRNPAYAPMLNFKSAKFDAIEVRGNEARQRVTLTAADGAVAVYVFILGKQGADGELHDCWMTNGVIRIDPNAPPPGGGESDRGTAI